MSPKLKGLVFLLILILCFACKEEEYSLKLRTTVRGQVRLMEPNGDLLDSHDGVLVSALGGPSQVNTITDAEGNYELELSTGVYDLQFTKEGFDENRLLNLTLLGDNHDEAKVDLNGVFILYQNSSLPIRGIEVELYTDTVSSFLNDFFDSTRVTIRGEIEYDFDSLKGIQLGVFTSGIYMADIATDGYNRDSTFFEVIPLSANSLFPISDGSFFEVDVRLRQLINGRVGRYLVEMSNEVYFQIYASQRFGRTFPSVDRSRYLVSGLNNDREMIKITLDR